MFSPSPSAPPHFGIVALMSSIKQLLCMCGTPLFRLDPVTVVFIKEKSTP